MKTTTTPKKKGNNTFLYAGLAGLAILGIASASASTPKTKVGDDTFEPEAPAPNTNTTTTPNPKPVVVAALNKNLILKYGSVNNEVKELQKLLKFTGSDVDGKFFGDTEAALLKLKNVKEITLNNFSKVASVNASAYVVGDKIMSNNKNGATLFAAAKNAAGNYYLDGKTWSTIDYGNAIGVIKGMNSTKTMYLTSVKDWGGNIDVYVFVNATSVKKY